MTSGRSRLRGGGGVVELGDDDVSYVTCQVSGGEKRQGWRSPRRFARDERLIFEITTLMRDARSMMRDEFQSWRNCHNWSFFSETP